MSASKPTPFDRIAPPTTFLSLAPATSASYPTSPPRSASTASTAASETKKENPVEVAGAQEIIAEVAKQRRSSSTVSSESAGSVQQRFLKLGPAHWGENVDGKGDWADME